MSYLYHKGVHCSTTIAGWHRFFAEMDTGKFIESLCFRLAKLNIQRHPKAPYPRACFFEVFDQVKTLG